MSTPIRPFRIDIPEADLVDLRHQLALVDAEHLVGVHLTAGLGFPSGDPAELEGLTDEERAGVAPFYAWSADVLVADLGKRLGRPGSSLRAEQLDPVRRWAARWRRRAGV